MVIARGGFSGLFPDSSLNAYQFASAVSVPDLVLWCDVQLTKDAVGICFPSLDLQNSSVIKQAFPNASNTYAVNGVSTQGYFSIDFTFQDLSNVPCKSLQNDLILVTVSSFLVTAENNAGFVSSISPF